MLFQHQSSVKPRGYLSPSEQISFVVVVVVAVVVVAAVAVVFIIPK